jgi:hypothetical protein
MTRLRSPAGPYTLLCAADSESIRLTVHRLPARGSVQVTILILHNFRS